MRAVQSASAIINGNVKALRQLLENAHLEMDGRNLYLDNNNWCFMKVMSFSSPPTYAEACGVADQFFYQSLEIPPELSETEALRTFMLGLHASANVGLLSQTKAYITTLQALLLLWTELNQTSYTQRVYNSNQLGNRRQNRKRTRRVPSPVYSPVHD